MAKDDLAVKTLRDKWSKYPHHIYRAIWSIYLYWRKQGVSIEESAKLAQDFFGEYTDELP